MVLPIPSPQLLARDGSCFVATPAALPGLPLSLYATPTEVRSPELRSSRQSLIRGSGSGVGLGRSHPGARIRYADGEMPVLCWYAVGSPPSITCHRGTAPRRHCPRRPTPNYPHRRPDTSPRPPLTRSQRIPRACHKLTEAAERSMENDRELARGRRADTEITVRSHRGSAAEQRPRGRVAVRLARLRGARSRRAGSYCIEEDHENGR